MYVVQYTCFLFFMHCIVVRDMWCMAGVIVLLWSVLSLWNLEKIFHLHIQNKFRFEKRLSGYVRKGFICFSPASSGGKSLGMQGTVSNNPAVPIETLKTIPDCKMCVFPCLLISLLTTIELILFKTECTKNILCLQEISRFRSELQYFISHISGVILICHLSNPR